MCPGGSTQGPREFVRAALSNKEFSRISPSSSIGQRSVVLMHSMASIGVPLSVSRVPHRAWPFSMEMLADLGPAVTWSSLSSHGGSTVF